MTKSLAGDIEEALRSKTAALSCRELLGRSVRGLIVLAILVASGGAAGSEWTLSDVDPFDDNLPPTLVGIDEASGAKMSWNCPTLGTVQVVFDPNDRMFYRLNDNLTPGLLYRVDDHDPATLGVLVQDFGDSGVTFLGLGPPSRRMYEQLEAASERIAVAITSEGGRYYTTVFSVDDHLRNALRDFGEKCQMR